MGRHYGYMETAPLEHFVGSASRIEHGSLSSREGVML